jgi:hypothetical protein
MKTTDLPLHNHIDLLSADDLEVVVGSVKHTVELKLAAKRFWSDPVHFKLSLPVRTKILHLAPEE